MKIHPVGAELFHADGWTDRHDVANSRFSQFYDAPPKQRLTSVSQPPGRGINYTGPREVLLEFFIFHE